MTYPDSYADLLVRAQFDMGIFERCSADICQELIDEVIKLRAIIEAKK